MFRGETEVARHGLMAGGVVEQALVGAIVGGILTGLGSLIVALTVDRRGRRQHERQLQLDAAKEVLGSLQNLNRKLINIARHPLDGVAQDEPLWAEQLDAATRWNAARYGAALVCPASQLVMLDALDRETDRVFDQALSRQWTGREFRSERERLGQLAADCLVEVRRDVGLPAVEIESLWAWDSTALPPIGTPSLDGEK
jgi:hypothetical protein